MAQYPPLVIVAGQVRQLLATDTISGASVANTTWTTLTLTNNWSGTAEYCIVGGSVFLNGVLSKNARPTAGETILTLPSGARPTRTMRFSTVDNNIPTALSATSKPYLEVTTAGVLSYGNYGTVPNPSAGITLTDVNFPIL